MSVWILVDRDNNIFNVAESEEMAEHLKGLQPNIVEPRIRKCGVWGENNYEEFYNIVFASRDRAVR
jgi:hypothetical protein